MNNLEQELGCKLFVRSHQGVALTPEGRRLFLRVAAAYEQLRLGEEEIQRDCSLDTGTISIGTNEVALHLLLLDKLSAFHEKFPGVHIRITSGPAIEKPGDLAALLTNLQEGDVLFIDEIHRLSRQVEEVLYPALEDYALDIMIGKGPSAQSIRINLPRFTLIGATTRAGQLTGPLRDRFGVLLKLELYSPDELARIIRRSAGILGQPCTEEGALELAKCSRGTPRVANRLLKRVRDFATVQGDGAIDGAIAVAARKQMDIDAQGLDELDRGVLRAIIELYGGGPVGLDTLAAALGEESVTLEDICEPYLMQLGYLTRTPRGRCVTRLAYEHLRLPVPRRLREDADEADGQQSLY